MNRGIIRKATEKMLIKYQLTRANDIFLCQKVLEELNLPTDLKELAKKTQGVNILESIRRSRQKIQETNPMLKPNEQVSKRRKQLEEEIRNEMRGI